jgi:hypothetical protein
MSIMLSSWLRNSSSLRGAGFFGGIGKPHHRDQHTESQHEFRRKPPRAQARKIASFLPNPAPNLANPITSIPPKPTRFQRFQPFSRATIYTLIQTAKLNDVDPQAWLADVLARIADHPATRLDELLPWNWAAQARAIAA